MAAAPAGAAAVSSVVEVPAHGGREPRPPADPTGSVFVDVGPARGALVVRAPAERAGLEVEIHPVGAPGQRTHVWVLPRQVLPSAPVTYAGLFPSLEPGEYQILEPDGSPGNRVAVVAAGVVTADWGVTD